MKVAQEIDVDNVTIIINPQNKLEAKIPTTSSEVVIEEVPNVTPNNTVVTLNGTEHRIVKLGKVNGTEWLVFQLDSPAQPAPSNIITFIEVNCGRVEYGKDRYVMTDPVSVKVTTSDTGGKIPQTVKFDVTVGSQTRTYSYPYSASNTYEWNSINDFRYEGHTNFTFGNVSVEFTDGSVSLPNSFKYACMLPLPRD